MLVGAHRPDDETRRLHEYSPGESTPAFAFDSERFAAHEHFFVEDVRRWTQARFGVALPADPTAVFGVSAGGELALAMGLRHPDLYGAVLSASPGAGYRPLPCCRARCRGPTSSPARTSHSFAQTRPAGRMPCAMPAGRGPDRAGRRPRRSVLERRAPAHGGVGVRPTRSLRSRVSGRPPWSVDRDQRRTPRIPCAGRWDAKTNPVRRAATLVVTEACGR